MEKKSIAVNPEELSEAKPEKQREKQREKKTPAVGTEPPAATEALEAPAATEATETNGAESAEAGADEVYLGKFKSVDALVRAYRELEAEFTRRSQKLKTLEESAPPCGTAEEKRVLRDEELYEAVTKNEGIRARVVGDYLSSLKGVPLMTGGGAGVKTPADRPKSIREAGSLALGYLRGQKN